MYMQEDVAAGLIVASGAGSDAGSLRIAVLCLEFGRGSAVDP